MNKKPRTPAEKRARKAHLEQLRMIRQARRRSFKRTSDSPSQVSRRLYSASIYYLDMAAHQITQAHRVAGGA